MAARVKLNSLLVPKSTDTDTGFPKPQPKQQEFLDSDADIAIYGGSAGSGKTLALLLDFAKPELLENPHYGGVIFRRTSPEITNEGGLWDEAGIWYPSLGATSNQKWLRWTFPTGASVRFAHLQHEKNIYNWQGSQVSRCVARGTLILMADGTSKPVEQISVGDMVETLQGACPVTNASSSGFKKVYRVYAGTRSVVVSETHKFLTDSGWVALAEALPTQSQALSFDGLWLSKSFSAFDKHRGLTGEGLGKFGEVVHQTLLKNFDKRPSLEMELPSVFPGLEQSTQFCAYEHTALGLMPKRSVFHKPFSFPLLDQPLSFVHVLQSQCQIPYPVSAALTVGNQSGFLEFDGLRRVEQPLLKLSCRLVLHAPSALSASPFHAQKTPERAPAHVPFWSVFPGSLSDYQSDCGSCGEQFHHESTGDQCSIPLQGGAASHSRFCYCNWGEMDNALGHSIHDQYRYVHPYTKEALVSRCPVFFSETYAVPLGEQECFDLTILGASHYITHNGIISQNCAFDEVTHFTKKQFFYLMTRMRSTHGIKPQLRATCNPDAESWLAELVDWWINPQGYPYPERSGKLRWFIVKSDEVIWADSAEELRSQYPNSNPKSFTFISAKLTDNPALLEKDPHYLANLEAQDVVERARLLDGNWRVKKSESRLFKAEAITASAHGAWSDPVFAKSYLFGIDPNFGGDDSFSCQVWDISEAPYSLVAEYKQSNSSITASINQCSKLVERYNPVLVSVETNGGGRTVQERLIEHFPGIRIEAVTTTKNSKIINTDRIAIALEEGLIQFPPDWDGIDELRSFSKETREAITGHDDSVMAWAVAFAYIEEARQLALINPLLLT